MSIFQKRETKREVKILGRWYSVDFGRDDIAVILRKVQVELQKIQEKERGDLGQAERFIGMMNEEKALLREAIGQILCCPAEVDAIFVGDESAVLHRDIYTFLAEEFIQVMKTKSPYDVERIEGI